MDSTSYVGSSTSLSSYLATASTSETTNLRQFANLDLTEDQRTKLRSIAQSAKTSGISASDLQSEIDGVLTPDQQAKLKTDMASAGHSGPPPSGPPPSGPPPSMSVSASNNLATAANASGSSTTATINGLTSEDLQNQTAAANSLTQQQLLNAQPHSDVVRGSENRPPDVNPLANSALDPAGNDPGNLVVGDAGLGKEREVQSSNVARNEASDVIIAPSQSRIRGGAFR